MNVSIDLRRLKLFRTNKTYGVLNSYEAVFNMRPGYIYVAESLYEALYDDHLCLIASSKQQI